jgi:hypothetical protein
VLENEEGKIRKRKLKEKGGGELREDGEGERNKRRK